MDYNKIISSELKTEVSFLKICGQDLTIEGIVFIPVVPDLSNFELIFQVNKEIIIPCRKYKVSLRDEVSNSIVVASAIGFIGSVTNYEQYPFLRIGLCLRFLKEQIENIPLSTGRFFPVASVFKNAYAYRNGYIFSLQDNIICAVKAGFAEHIKRECLFLKELLCVRNNYNLKAIAARCFYHIAMFFKKKEMWLISDRINKADDNGEALFKYLNEKAAPENLFFIIRKDSSDYAIIKKYGKVIAYSSIKHLLFHLLADAVISSNGDDYVHNPFGKYGAYFADILSKQKRVFLRHGVSQSNQTRWLNKFNQNFAMIVTTAVKEYEAFLRQEYYYDENIIKLTGLARHDRLYDNRKRIITVMPTWRSYIIDYSQPSSYKIDGQYHYDKKCFIDTEYFRFYNCLLNNKRLLQKAKEYGYTIQFMPHPNIIPYINWFQKNDKVRLCSVKTKYRDVFAESALIVTDYSSVAFDFAYLRKPVLYCQFDKECFFFKHIFQEGYFDYEQEGFGEVTYKLEDTVDRIIDYMEHDCELKDVYRKRINNFFAFHDKNNCQRIYEALKTLG